MPINSPGYSVAAGELGLGDMLQKQAADETEEERRKRMLQMSSSRTMGPEQSLAVASIFGSMGGPRGAGY